MTDPSARAALADCRSRMAWLLSRTGQTAEALTAYRLARSEQEALAGGPGAPKEARRDLADTIYQDRHAAEAIRANPAEAEAEFRTGLAIQQKLADDNPAVTDFRIRLASSHINLGVLLSQDGQAGGGGGRVPPAELGIYAEAGRRPPRRHRIPQHLASSHHQPRLAADGDGQAGGGGGRVPHGAGDLSRSWPPTTPPSPEFRSRLAISHVNLGHLLTETGKPTEAEAELRLALEIFRKLAADHPAVTDFRSRLADSHHNLGVLLYQTGRPTEAEAEFRRAAGHSGEAGR